MPSDKELYNKFQEQIKKGFNEREARTNLASQLGLNIDSIRGRLSRYNKEREEIVLVGESTIPSQINTRLTQWKEFSDKDKLDRYFKKLKSETEITKIVHLSDIHHPFSDEKALSLMIKILEDIQPNIIVSGSDCFDNPEEGMFEKRADFNRQDWVVNNFSFWQSLMGKIIKIAPVVYIFGNHEKRYIKDVNAEPSYERNLYINDYRKQIKFDNRIFWLGDVYEVNFGNQLVVAHGEIFSQNTAKDLLHKYFYQINAMQGHTHRPDFYTVNGYLYPVSGLVNGCLCQTTPHYSISEHSKWQQGFGVAYLSGNNVQLENIIFKNENKSLVSVYGGKKFRI